MAFTESLVERTAFAEGGPGTLNNTSFDTGNGINMAILRRAKAVLNVGTVTSTGSLNFSLQASATSGGSYSAITNNTTNPTLTALTTANSIYILEIRADQMPTGKPWLKAIATETASQNVVCSLILEGDESGYKPVNTTAGAAAQSPALSTATITSCVVTAT